MDIITWIISKLFLVGYILFVLVVLLAVWKEIRYGGVDRPFFEEMTEEEIKKWEETKKKMKNNIF